VQAPVTYLVTTTSVFRKYTFLGDLPLTALPFTWRILEALTFPSLTADKSHGQKALIANTLRRYFKTREAFKHHDSQYSWDRHLYLILSRYVWFNDLVRVPRAAQEQSWQ
jgi:N-acetylglucosaminylphosphatidylinositol deacetylase